MGCHRLLFLLLFGLVGCGEIVERLPWNQKVAREPVAKVFDKYLYTSDISEIVPKGIPKDDSIQLANAYIDTWITTQLLLDKAQLNLPPDELDISRQIEAYRTSLLIYRYKEQMIRSRLDTVVYPYELEAHYEAHKADFVLNETVIRGVFAKLPLAAPDVEKIRIKFGSTSDRDIDEVSNYCSLYAIKYVDFDDAWITGSRLQAEWPVLLPDPMIAFRSVDVIEYKDNNFLYLIHMKEIVVKGDIAPFASVKEKILDLILNKRKMAFSTHLERELYEDALNKKLFTIYQPEQK